MKSSFMSSVNTSPFFSAMEEDQKSKHRCRFCHKIFPCGRSLGGHMRSHLLTISSTHKKKKKLPILVHHNECGRSFQSLMEKDSWIHHHHHHHRPFIITDNMSARKKKRSERNKSSDSSEAKKTAAFSCLDSKSSSSEELDVEFKAPIKKLKSSEELESEVTSPKTLIQENGSDSDHTKQIRNSDLMNECKFSCVICRKGFPSYHALGGHRASHKKFRGCCAPDFQEMVDAGVECKKSKGHECPICFKVFSSGQALGGHKRSHLNTDPSVSIQTRIPENRGFLDLNSPAPADEDCSEFKTWWIGTSHSNHQQLLLGLLST